MKALCVSFAAGALAGCGFVARTHAGNLPHVREMIREAIAYPGFAFVQVLAACVTFQAPGSDCSRKPFTFSTRSR